MKNSFRQFPGLYFLIGIVCLIASCSSAVNVNNADTIRDLYATGMQKIEANDLKGAEEALNKIIALESHSPYGNTGLAYLEMKRTNYRPALDYIKKALKKDSSFADAYAVKGAILTTRKRGDNWYKESVEAFERALALDPENERANYFYAECDLKAQRYSEALPRFKKIAESKGLLTARAKERVALVERIIPIGSIPESCSYIILDDKIDRTDLSMLLVDHFHLMERAESARSNSYGSGGNGSRRPAMQKIPPDINNNKAKKTITSVLSLNLSALGVMPNGYFYADRIMTRAQFAAVMQDILVLLKGDESLATRYVGSTSTIPDVRADFYAYNAVALVMELHIMDADSASGAFKPEVPVSGLEAMEFLKRLDAAVK